MKFKDIQSKMLLSITILVFCIWCKNITVSAADSITVTETNKTTSNTTQMLPALQLINNNNNNDSNNVKNNTNKDNKGAPSNTNSSHIQNKSESSVIQTKTIKTAGDLNNNNNNNNIKNKDNNIFYTHNDNTPKRCAYENVVQNHTFALNKRAGVFTHLGHTRDIHQCKQMCCQVRTPLILK